MHCTNGQCPFYDFLEESNDDLECVIRDCVNRTRFEDGDEVLNLGSDPNNPNDPGMQKVPSLGAPGVVALALLMALAGGRLARGRRSGA